MVRSLPCGISACDAMGRMEDVLSVGKLLQIPWQVADPGTGRRASNARPAGRPSACGSHRS